MNNLENIGKKKKIEVDGWLEVNEEREKKVKCPKCGKKLRQVNALQLCNWFFIYCENSKCRYCELYIE